HDRADTPRGPSAGPVGQRVGDGAVAHHPPRWDPLHQVEHGLHVLLGAHAGPAGAAVRSAATGRHHGWSGYGTRARGAGRPVSRAGENGAVRPDPRPAPVPAALAAARRIVVKVGSSSMTTVTDGLDPRRLEALVAALAAAGDRELVLVSSGRSEEHTSELQSREKIDCSLLLATIHTYKDIR